MNKTNELIGILEEQLRFIKMTVTEREYLENTIKKLKKAINYTRCCETLKEDKPKTFELWMQSKGYRQNSKKQWLKHVYTMDARTLNNFKLEYESL